MRYLWEEFAGELPGGFVGSEHFSDGYRGLDRGGGEDALNGVGDTEKR